MVKKNPKADLRSFHTIFMQLGIILVLIFLIAATKTEFRYDTGSGHLKPGITPDVPLVNTPPVIPPEKPAPLKPMVAIEVPNDTPLEVDIIEFPEFELGDAIVPPPDPPDNPNEIFNTFGIEVLPEMKGGLQKLYSEIIYPEKARAAGIQGRVYIEFIVNKDGKVEEPRLIRGIGGGCDEEVLKAIKLMRFTPGVQNGNLVNVRMSQVVVFKMNN